MLLELLSLKYVYHTPDLLKPLYLENVLETQIDLDTSYFTSCGKAGVGKFVSDLAHQETLSLHVGFDF